MIEERKVKDQFNRIKQGLLDGENQGTLCALATFYHVFRQQYFSDYLPRGTPYYGTSLLWENYG